MPDRRIPRRRHYQLWFPSLPYPFLYPAPGHEGRLEIERGDNCAVSRISRRCVATLFVWWMPSRASRTVVSGPEIPCLHHVSMEMPCCATFVRLFASYFMICHVDLVSYLCSIISNPRNLTCSVILDRHPRLGFPRATAMRRRRRDHSDYPILAAAVTSGYGFLSLLGMQTIRQTWL